MPMVPLAHLGSAQSGRKDCYNWKKDLQKQKLRRKIADDFPAAFICLLAFAKKLPYHF